MKKYTLITGASFGIGLELAKIFASKKNNLILTARSKDNLEVIAKELKEKYNIEVEVIPKDLASPTAPNEIYEEIKRKNIFVDVLINNAGFGLYGEFKSNELQKELDMIQVNITSLTVLTKLFLPKMIENKNGKILNVASVAAFQPGPLMAIYYATKAYVLSFSEAIANELNNTGVTVSCLCPGPTITEFQNRAKLEASRLFKIVKPMTAKEVAEIGYDGLMSGVVTNVTGFRNSFATFSIRFFPRKLVTKVVRLIQENTKKSF